MANTVTVISKLPFGLQLSHKGVAFNIKGANSTTVRDMKGLIPKGAFGQTEVDADLWTAWSAENQSLPFLIKGMVFAKDTKSAALGEAKDKAGETTGLEGINQDTKKDDRVAGLGVTQSQQ